jgi:hypothetical protein
MSGPGPEHAREQPPSEARNDAGKASPRRPPGEFLTDDLASATARFLEEVKERIHRAAEGDQRTRAPRR